MTERNTHEQPADVAIGIDAAGTRREFDSLGTVDVPADGATDRR